MKRGTLSERLPQSGFTPSSSPVLQRKCACGNHTKGGECGDCARKESSLRREASYDSETSRVPPIVQDVLRSSGRPLDDATRAFMEPRFGHDFSHVRVHTHAKAVESAKAVNALAYTVGSNIVFDESRYGPETKSRRQLIAHELSHTLQQKGGVTGAATTVSDLGGAAEREAENLADQIITGSTVQLFASVSARQGTLFRIPLPTRGSGPPSTGLGSPPPSTARATQTPAPVPARGSNPADCIEAVCRLATSSVPANDSEATQRIDDWERATIACVQAGGPSSNASHQAQIVANEIGEIAAEANELRKMPSSLGRSRRRFVDFRDAFNQTCTRKARELKIEFHYNVVFENPTGATQWGYGAGDWDSIDRALSALPPEATWTNPRLITFARAACHPNDLTPSGACVGHSSGSARGITGGEADPSTGRITVFNAGLGSGPYSRSASLGLPATQQTLRHEVGHIVMSQISQAEQDQFFTRILPWKDYSWSWITSPAPRYPNWQAERDSLRKELGFNEAKLDAWLPSIRPNTPVTVGARTYTRDAAGSGGTTLFLSAVDATQLPAGIEFEYARTNHGEYLAELYALAVSRPEFLHSVLPQPQVEWLKRVVFRTPATPDQWARQLAVGGNVPPQLFARLLRVFTWDQAQPIVDEIISPQSAAGDRAG
jgi:hypothetical protein